MEHNVAHIGYVGTEINCTRKYPWVLNVNTYQNGSL